nr:MAG TPA: hypothetical protein [Caudoviricetes sp.]
MYFPYPSIFVNLLILINIKFLQMYIITMYIKKNNI